MSSAVFFVLMAGILIPKGQGTDQEFRSYERHTIFVPKGKNYFLNVSGDMVPLTKATCVYHEVHALILKNSKYGNVSPSRLASIPLQELKAQSIIGVITKDTQQEYQLGEVSFICTVNYYNKSTSHGKLELHLKLEIVIPEATTNHPLFDEIEMVVRCLNSSDVSSLGTRHEAGHYRLVYYNETSEGPTLNSTDITQASQSLGLAATPSPDPGSSEEKKSPPGEGPTNSTGISTQASPSLGLPVTPSPDPGSSEEKKNSQDTKRKTDRSHVLYFVLGAALLSLVRWITIVILSRIYRGPAS